MPASLPQPRDSATSEGTTNRHSPEQEFVQVGDAIMERVSRPTAPELILAEPYVADVWSWRDLNGWGLLPPELEPLVSTLDDLLNHLPAAIDGNHVIHADLTEADVVIAGEKTRFTAWNPKLSQPWIMWAPLAPSAHVQGVDVNRIFAEHPLTRNVPPEYVTAYFAGNASKEFYRSHETGKGKDPRLLDRRRRSALASLDLALNRIGLETPDGLADWRPTRSQPKQSDIFGARFPRPKPDLLFVPQPSFLLKSCQLAERGSGIRALARDQDGTSGPDGKDEIGPRLAAVLEDVSNAGLHDFLITARDPVAFAKVYELYPLLSGVALRDGGTITARNGLGDPRLDNLRLLRHFEWSRHTVASALTALDDEYRMSLTKAAWLERGVPGIHRPDELGRHMLIEPDFRFMPGREVRRSVLDCLASSEFDGYYVPRAFITAPDGIPFQDFHETARGLLEEICVLSPVPAERAVRLQPRFDDAGVAVEKDVGLTILTNYFGFGPENTVAYMNGWNDEPMRAVAGGSVGVADSQPAILARVDYVTETMANDGVAVHVEEDVLPAVRNVRWRFGAPTPTVREQLDRRRITR